MPPVIRLVATAARLSATSGLASRLAADALRSAMSPEAGQQTNARLAAGRFATASWLSAASGLSATSGLGATSGLASRSAATLRSALRTEAGQQTHARFTASRLTSRFATTSRLSAACGLTSGLAAGVLRSAMGFQTSKQTNARSAAGRLTGGFTTTGRGGFTATARFGTTTAEQTSVRTRRADQTEQADRQGGKNHTNLHWEGSSIQNVCKCDTCLRAAAGPACSHLDGGPTLACAKTPASPSCCIREIVSTR